MIHIFHTDPEFRGRAIFMMLLAAGVVTGLGWLHSSERAKASSQTEAAITRVERRRKLTIVSDK